MSSKAKKIIGLTSSLIIIFVLINFLIVIPAYASSSASLVSNVTGGTIKVESNKVATVVKFISAFVQILVIGYFSIRLTVVGIRFFIATTADEKAAKKTAISRTLFWAVIAIGVMYAILHIIGL